MYLLNPLCNLTENISPTPLTTAFYNLFWQFSIVFHKEWDAILHDIRLEHEADAESAPDDSDTLKMIADAEKAMRFPGNALDKFCYVMCSQLQISYEKLTEKERTDLKNIMKKSSIYKDSPLGIRKR